MSSSPDQEGGVQKDKQVDGTSVSADATNDTPLADDSSKPAPMSKNQMKKKRRWEKMMENKRRRKEQNKEVKRAKAKEQGRDIEQERKKQEEGRLKGDNKRRQRQAWEQKKVPLIDQSFQVCLDCAFEDSMTLKEINSLASQLRFCYSVNKRSSHPCQLSATSVSGTTLRHLKNVSGYEEWSNWAFTVTSESLEQYFQKELKNVVYLTSDSETILEDLDEDKIYIIGGIVDRNRLKRAAIDRAQTLGVSTARLPINEHLNAMAATRVLTCNQVFELLLKYRENRRDWKAALQSVLPSRKGATFKETTADEL